MEPLRETFNRLRRSGRTALIPFIVGGDPSLRATPELLLTLEDAGADCIEVGIPFSDPLADGPVIQAASARALARGVTPPKVLSAVASVRHRLRVPVVCLTYWNPVVQFAGNGRGENPTPFLNTARRSGISGLIVPDLPVEEGALLHRLAVRAQVAPIFLAAPTSPPDRLRMIARASEGFIYYVSVTGTTGVRRSLPPSLRHGVRQLRLLTTKPICVGFGIATPSQAREVARIADGVIVGSALVRMIEQAGSHAAALSAARTLLTRLRRAVT
jgi:tryptophan synthase alpha chain